MPSPLGANPVAQLLERIARSRAAVVGVPAEDTPAARLLDGFLDSFRDELVEVEEADLVLVFDDVTPLPPRRGRFLVAVSCAREEAALHIDAEDGGVWSRVGDDVLSLLPFEGPAMQGGLAVITDSGSVARQLLQRLGARGRGAAFVGVASPGEVELADLVDLAARHSEVAAVLLAYARPGDAEALRRVLDAAGRHLPIVELRLDRRSEAPAPVGGDTPPDPSSIGPLFAHAAPSGPHGGWPRTIRATGFDEAASMAVALSDVDPPESPHPVVLGAAAGLRSALRLLAAAHDIDLAQAATSSDPNAIRGALDLRDTSDLVVVVGGWMTLEHVLGTPPREGSALRIALLDSEDVIAPGVLFRSFAWRVPVFPSVDDVVHALRGLLAWSRMRATP